jgi:hypothetical protein
VQLGSGQVFLLPFNSIEQPPGMAALKVAAMIFLRRLLWWRFQRFPPGIADQVIHKNLIVNAIQQDSSRSTSHRMMAPVKLWAKATMKFYLGGRIDR